MKAVESISAFWMKKNEDEKIGWLQQRKKISQKQSANEGGRNRLVR
jgi:hypothetical protein